MLGRATGSFGSGTAPAAVALTAVLILAGLSISLPAPTADAAGLNLVPDLVTPERSFETVTWEHTLDEGGHLLFHYRSDTGTQGIVKIVDDEGHEILHAYSTSQEHFISDGRDSSGTVQYKAIGGDPWFRWLRGDIVLDGDTYTYHVDKREPVQARTFTHATQGQFGDPSTIPSVAGVAEIAQQRILGSHARVYGASTSLAEDPHWQAHGPTDEVRAQTGNPGYLSLGQLHIDAPETLSNVSYVHTDQPDRSFIAEASFRPLDPSPALLGGVPDHQAILAGISGPDDAPTVHWALVMAPYAPAEEGSRLAHQAPTYWEWSIYLIDGQDTRTQVAPTWNPFEARWHHVQVHVDPGTKALEVRVDLEGPALRFEDAFEAPGELIATGDTWQDRLFWTGGSEGYYDNLVVDPVGVGS